MKDPVMDPEGNSYERFAILKWLEDHSTSPITRSQLRKEDLVPNRALKDLLNCSDEKTELKNNGKKVYDKFEKTKDVNPKASPLTIAMKGGFDPKENQVLIQVNPSDDDPSMYKSHSPRNLVCVARCHRGLSFQALVMKLIQICAFWILLSTRPEQ